MKRIFVKAGLANLSVAKKIVLGNSVATGLDNNPLLPNAVQMRQDLLNVTVTLTTSKALTAGGSHAAQQAMLNAENDFDKVMNTVILFVQAVADASATTELAKEIILSANFGVRKSPETWPEPEQVIKIAAVYTGEAGVIVVKWRGRKHSKFFRLYHTITPDDINSWSLVDTTSGRKSLQTGLGLVVHYYRVVAVNNSGHSIPSPTVSCVCMPA